MNQPRRSDGTGDVQLPTASDLRSMLTAKRQDNNAPSSAPGPMMMATHETRPQPNQAASAGAIDRRQQQHPWRRPPAAAVVRPPLRILPKSTSHRGLIAEAKRAGGDVDATPPQGNKKHNTPWKRVVDRSSMETYYQHSITKKVQHEMPDDYECPSDEKPSRPPLQHIHREQQQQQQQPRSSCAVPPVPPKVVYEQPQLSTTSSVMSGDGVWKSAFDRDRGRTYYYHSITKEVSWIKPDQYFEKDVFREGSSAPTSRPPPSRPNPPPRLSAPSHDTQRREATGARTVPIQEGTRIDPMSWGRNLKAEVNKALTRALPEERENREIVLRIYQGQEDDLLKALNELLEDTPAGRQITTQAICAKVNQVKKRRKQRMPVPQENVRPTLPAAASTGHDVTVPQSSNGEGNLKSAVFGTRAVIPEAPGKTKVDQTMALSRTFSCSVGSGEDSGYAGRGYGGGYVHSDALTRSTSSKPWRRMMFIGALMGIVCFACVVWGSVRYSGSGSNGESSASSIGLTSGGQGYASQLTTDRPTRNPTDRPTIFPTEAPTPEPTVEPTAEPTPRPTLTPTRRPTDNPTNRPSPRPTSRPTNPVTAKPTLFQRIPDHDFTVVDITSVPEESVGGGSISGGDGYEHVVGRVDSMECPTRENTLPLLVSVTNREVLIGCHSFEEYLSPKFETVFILNEDFVKGWEIDKLVLGATCEQTLGAHVLMLGNQGGELLGRRLSVDYLENDVMPRRDIEFLNQMNCDVHPIPQAHSYHKPLEHMLEKMIGDFRLIRAQREPDDYPNVDLPDFDLVDNINSGSDWMGYRILAMAPLLFEDFPEMDKLPEKTHGHDVCKWEAGDGLDDRPDEFGEFPWLCDVHSFTENHILMFDVKKLTSEGVRHHYLDAPRAIGIDSFSSDTRTTPRIAAQHGLTIVVNRDVYAHQNFGHGPSALDGYAVSDLDLHRVLNFNHVSILRSPETVYNVWNGLNSAIIEEPYIGGTVIAFVAMHFFSDGVWMPKNLYGQPLNECVLCRQMVDSMMRICGYEAIGEDDDTVLFALKGNYPANVFVTVTDDDDFSMPNDSWEFLRMEVGGKVFRYFALGSVETEQMKEMEPRDRIVPVMKDGKINELFGPSEIKRREYIHRRGRFRRDNDPICGAPDQDEDSNCGYLDDDKFDIPY